jgi:lipopolysaccharide assembly outer membrane protein LptD (OstA)
MVFEKNIKANYEDSELYGERIVYLNSKKTLIISENVKISDIRGTMRAEKLLFDLEKKTLDISSDENKINADIIIK